MAPRPAPSVASARRPRGLSTARTRVLPWRSSTMTDDDTALSHRIAAYRQAREQIERSLLPLATSVEGARFTFQAPLHDLEIRRGGYLTLEGAGVTRLGLVTDIAAETWRTPAAGDATGAIDFHLARGHGLVVDSDGRPFHDAAVRPAPSAAVRAWLGRIRSTRNVLAVGELLHAAGVEAALDCAGLGRHT